MAVISVANVFVMSMRVIDISNIRITFKTYLPNDFSASILAFLLSFLMRDANVVFGIGVK